MTKRYETARSCDEPPLMLIFLEGSWESLPFEIRLLRPWYGREFCDRNGVNATQRLEVAMRGYSIAPLVNTPKIAAVQEPDAPVSRAGRAL